MPTISRVITTEAPIDDVFAYLADFSNAAEWDPGTASSAPRDGGPPHVGEVYDLVVTWGSRSLDMQYELVDLEEPTLIKLVGDGSTTAAIDTMILTELPDGGTSVHYSADIRLKGVLRIAEPFLGSKFAALGDAAEREMGERLASLAR